MKKANSSFISRIKEEFFQTTETLWNNEVQANLFVARILIYTSVIAALIIVLSVTHVFSINNEVMVRYLSLAIAEMLIPAAICMYFKGEKPWLKVLLMVAYVIVLARLHMILGHNIVLCLVFPVVLSVRYYSKYLTSFVSGLTIVTYLASSYYGITHEITRVDLNMVELPGGTVLEFPEFAELRSVIDPALIDYNRLFLHFLQHSFLPKFILFLMIAIICTLIAERGRRAIFAQKAETEKTERLATELNLASNIQTNMLPNIFPVFPERKEFTLHASMTPAKEVGGDFYDYFPVDDNRLCFLIADVSGKGTPAALFMMTAKTMIKDYALNMESTSEIFTAVNARLCESNEAGMFATAWIGIADTRTMTLQYTNAGHNYPLLQRKGQPSEIIKKNHGLFLGGMEFTQYRMNEIRLEPGDRLLLYTDGVVEAHDRHDGLYGEDRLKEMLDRECRR